jgi:16S rRNA (cytidine1402-2'-O)-methyltransferase
MAPAEGHLFLLPNLLDDELAIEPFLPASVKEAVQSLDGLIAESEKGARRYLRHFVCHDRLAAMPLKLLNEHTPPSEIDSLLDPIARGECWGLLSDAGLPSLADPGAPLVFRAHQRHLVVSTLPGPSSIVMAIQLSGLPGQRFAFHGYLPREMPALQEALIHLEKRSRQDDATQIWIEAPYRSARIAAAAITTLQPSTFFCIALSLTTSRQRVCVQRIDEWRRQAFQIEKEPAVFLLFCPPK